eukprot:363138-Chlamydomonas_euryale.AAC.6
MDGRMLAQMHGKGSTQSMHPSMHINQRSTSPPASSHPYIPHLPHTTPRARVATQIGWDVYMLMWPLFAIAGVVLALYVACIVLFGAAEDSTIDMKLMYRVNVSATD